MALIARLAKIACFVETAEDFLTGLVTISLPSGVIRVNMFTTVLLGMALGAAHNKLYKIPFNVNE